MPSDRPNTTDADHPADPGTMVNAEAYDSDGVDRSLIRWMLRLTPAERLAHVQGVIDMLNSVRRPADGHR